MQWNLRHWVLRKEVACFPFYFAFLSLSLPPSLHLTRALLDHTKSKKKKNRKSKKKSAEWEYLAKEARKDVMQNTAERHIGQASLQSWRKGRLKEGGEDD